MDIFLPEYIYNKYLRRSQLFQEFLDERQVKKNLLIQNKFKSLWSMIDCVVTKCVVIDRVMEDNLVKADILS